MIKIQQSEWAGTADELKAAVVEFRAKLEAHKYTEGVDAPLAEPLVASLARLDGSAYEIVATEIDAAEVESKREAALRVLDDKRIADAAKVADAPAEVLEYIAKRDQLKQQGRG